MSKKLLGATVIAVTAIALLIGYFSANSKPGKLDGFAKCLKDKGAVFYGAYWCPHCQTQKKLFGKSQELLPYVECSTPDGKGQLENCKAKDITGYPTWEFADGSRVSGEMTLSDLAQKTSCQLPQ